LWLVFPFLPEQQAGLPRETAQGTREKIIALIQMNPSVTTREMAERIEITAKGIEWQLDRMKKEVLIGRVGPTKGL